MRISLRITSLPLIHIAIAAAAITSISIGIASIVHGAIAAAGLTLAIILARNALSHTHLVFAPIRHVLHRGARVATLLSLDPPNEPRTIVKTEGLVVRVRALGPWSILSFDAPAPTRKTEYLERTIIKYQGQS